MDAREAQQLKDSILAEVRKLIAARFQATGDELSTDSKVALQQLNTTLQGVKDVVARNNSEIALFRDDLSNVHQELAKLHGLVSASRIPREVEKLKEDLALLRLKVEADTTADTVVRLDTSMSSIITRVFALESGVKSDNGTSTNPLAHKLASLESFVRTLGSPTPSPQPAFDPTPLEEALKQLGDHVFSLTERVNKLPRPYDDTMLQDRLCAVEKVVATSHQTSKPFDPQPLLTEVRDVGVQLTMLKGMADRFQPTDLTPLNSKLLNLESKIAALESPKPPQPSIPFMGLAGLPNEQAITANRLDTLDSKFKVVADTMDTIIKVGASKNEIEAVKASVAGLEVRLHILETKK